MSGASSLRNAVKRVTHKERSQPSWNKNKGFLEKHKDYVVRAKDFKNKRAQIKSLRKKAAERNPDEFYFQMNSSKVANGVHSSLTDGSLDTDTVKLLKTQDLGYIVHRKAIDDNKAKRMKESLHMIGETNPRSHMVFVDSEEAVDSFDPVAHFDTVPELLGKAHNRLTTKKLNEIPLDAFRPKDMKKAMELRSRSYKELNQRIKRSEKLNNAIQNLQSQRISMGKGSKRKVQDAEDGKPAVYKFQRQRCK